jgi:uncharacterized protein YdiU (UPF0061 family)
MGADNLWKEIRFESRFVGSFPADPVEGPDLRIVRDAMYSRVRPTPVSAPRMVAWAPEVAELLGLSAEMMESPEGAQVLAGNRALEGMDPYAALYGGHQFGNWAGQLGDGRAITLGELPGRDGQLWEIQLKGAGPTPYARGADGRAVLRSSVREYLMSEAMHHLGVPTTRALSLVETGDRIVRDMFYDGRPRQEPGAIVCRVAPSFLRFGNFEIFTSRQEFDRLKELAEHTVSTHFAEFGSPGPGVWGPWLEEVARRTARTIVHWMRVGFVHGVMNTDNMSILGLTIDYGPYGWVDDYDPDWTPNTTDAYGRRYRFGHQPQIGLWNLARLVEACAPLIDDEAVLDRALEAYRETFEREQKAMYLAKLGWSEDRGDADVQLIRSLLSFMAESKADMTMFFRRLADVPSESEIDPAAHFEDTFYEPLAAHHREQLGGWLDAYRGRCRSEGGTDAERRESMNRTNPKFVLRNYMAQLAIDRAEQGDPSLVRELQDVLRRPYDEQPENAQWFARRPDWAKDRPGCSMLSCSS